MRGHAAVLCTPACTTPRPVYSARLARTSTTGTLAYHFIHIKHMHVVVDISTLHPLLPQKNKFPLRQPKPHVFEGILTNMVPLQKLIMNAHSYI